MSVQLIAWAYKQRVGSPTAKIVLVTLANRANHDTGLCCPSVSRIAEEVECNEKTVRRALIMLCEKGFITRERTRRNDGTLGVYQYRFQVDNQAQPQVTESASPPVTESAQEPEEDLQPPAVANATAAPVDIHGLVKEFVDLAREQQTEPPRRVVGQIARELKNLSAEATEDELRAALKRLLDRGLHPSSLPAALFDVRQRGSTNGHDPLGELLAAHDGKWPTGSRLVRGSNGAAYVRDVLGYDTPNHPVRWSKPTRAEILAALRKDPG